MLAAIRLELPYFFNPNPLIPFATYGFGFSVKIIKKLGDYTLDWFHLNPNLV